MGSVAIIADYGAQIGQKQLVTTPLCHAGANSIQRTHMQRGTVVLQSVFDPDTVLAAIERYRITSTTLVPTMINMVLSHPSIDRFDLSSLTFLGFGGSAMPLKTLREAIDRFGPILASGFGMSEVPGPIVQFSQADLTRAAASAPALLKSCGNSSLLVFARVVDDQIRDVGVGETGEIVVRGDLLFKGYWNDPETTAAAFRDGWFLTGDLATRDSDGYFYIVDRRRDMIITGGENVFSTEVETVIYEHPSVADVAVVGVPDPKWVETIAAVIVLRVNSTASADDIQQWCRSRLAGYKCPRYVYFWDEMPRSTLGKILKSDVRGATCVSRSETESSTSPARSDMKIRTW